MRISEANKFQIIQNAKNYFGNDIKLYLFGSHVDESKNGGDIDLCVESTQEIDLETQIKFLAALNHYGIDRKIDLLVNSPKRKHRPIFDMAKTEGIPLF
jgi:predicted nucleotidyltransferase